MVLCKMSPDYIAVTEEEKRRIFLPFNLGLKVAGSAAVVLALVLLGQ